MGRVTISLPDDLRDRAKDAGLSISSLARKAIAEELDRLAKVAALDKYLAELDTTFGPVSDELQARANEWVRRIVSPLPLEE